MAEPERSFDETDPRSRTEGAGKRDKRTRTRKYKKYNSFGTFKGKSKGMDVMDGHVFQVHSEQRKKRRFELTMKQLSVFVSTNYNAQAKYLAPLFHDLSVLSIPRPVLTKTKDSKGNEVVKEESTDFDKTVFAEKVKMWIKDESTLESTLQSILTIIIEQCSELMQNRLQAEKNYQTLVTTRDVSGMLKAIRAISSQVETNISIYDAVDEAKRRYYKTYQFEEDMNATYLNDYKSVIDIIEHYKSNIYEDPGLINYEVKAATDKGQTLSIDDARKIVKNKMQGLDLIKKADGRRYGDLLTNIRDKFALGIDMYPTSLNKAYDLLESYASSRKLTAKKPPPNNDKHTKNVTGLQYTQDGKKVVPGIDGKLDTISNVSTARIGGTLPINVQWRTKMKKTTTKSRCYKKIRKPSEQRKKMACSTIMKEKKIVPMTNL